MVDIVNIFDVVNIVNMVDIACHDHQHPSPGSKYAKDDIAHSVIPGLFYDDTNINININMSMMITHTVSYLDYFFIMISIHQFVKMILHTVNDEP